MGVSDKGRGGRTHVWDEEWDVFWKERNDVSPPGYCCQSKLLGAVLGGDEQKSHRGLHEISFEKLALKEFDRDRMPTFEDTHEATPKLALHFSHL